MSLLAPLFLLGAFVVAAPIIAHLVRRATRDRVRFSATQFLEPSPPRLDRRNRIEHPWLLLLRCLVVLALAAGFARPFLRDTPPDAGGGAPVRHTVAVLDASASLRRGDLWEQALARARALAADLGPGDRFALLIGGRQALLALRSEAWSSARPEERTALLEAALADRTSAGWEATHLDTAVDAALEELAAMDDAGTAARDASIVVISDFQESARVAGLAGRDWPAGVTVALEPLTAPARPNASIHPLGWATAPDGARQIRLRLAHDRDAPADYGLQVRAAADGRALAESDTVSLAPRETRAVTIPVPQAAPAAIRVDLAGDDEPFDNTVWLVPPESRTLPLVYLGTGDAADPKHALFYITRATAGWRDPAVAVRPHADGAGPVPDAPLHIIADSLAPSALAELRGRLEAGASVLVLADDAAVVASAAALAGEDGWSVATGPGRADAMLGDIAFTHPLFAPFADPRFSDFTRVRFWRHPVIALPADTRSTVVARFDDGSPAVIEAPVGRGTLVVWAGDWTPVASQWVLSTKFVPWFQALARRAGGGPPPPAMAEVGDGTALGLAPDAGAPRAPGVFEIKDGAAVRTVALNVPASESRTGLLPLDAWEQLGVPLATVARPSADAARAAVERAAVRAGSLAAAKLEAEQKLWRWLLLAAAALLALESAIAIRAAVRRGAAAPA